MRRSMILSVFLGALFAHSAFAQSDVKIGMITTLSGPAGYLGADVRDGFQLAVDEQNGKLGGIPVRVLVEDDGLKPGQGKEIADRFLGSEHVKILTGFIFSNVLEAVAPDAFDAGAFVISPNAGPSNFAGKDCNKLYFVTSWQNDAVFEAAGQNATNLDKKRAYVLAPNYQAGKDAIAGFKRFFKGEIVGESYTRLDQTDFGPEMAQIFAPRIRMPSFSFIRAGWGSLLSSSMCRPGCRTSRCSSADRASTAASSQPSVRRRRV